MTINSSINAGGGTTTTVLHGNPSGAPSYGAVSLTTDISGILSGANGGTGVANTGYTITLGGNFTTTGVITTLSGSNTGDQTITLTSDVTGSGTGSFVTTVAKINGVALGSTTATSGNLLIGSGTSWVTQSISGAFTLSSGGVATLASSGVTASTYGSGTSVGTFTVNAQGLITSASNVTITGAPPTGTAGGDLSGTYPNPTVSKINSVSLGTTTATAGNLLIGSGTAWVTQGVSGDITLTSAGVATLASSGVTANTYGSGTSVGTFTVNAKGLLTAASNAPITGGAISWNDVTATTQTMAVNSGYIADNAALVTLTLPSTAAVGSIIRIAGKGAGGWQIAQNASQLIHIGNQVTTAGATGYLASTNQWDSITLLCVTANTTFIVMDGPMGNITYN